MTTQDQITAAYDNPSLPWKSISRDSKRVYMVRTPLGHVESEDPHEFGGHPIKYRDDEHVSGVLIGHFRELGAIRYVSDEIVLTDVWEDGKRGKWIACDVYGNPTQ